jgi:hypothetical protein
MLTGALLRNVRTLKEKTSRAPARQAVKRIVPVDDLGEVTMNRFAAYGVIGLSKVLGGGSLLLFSAFLIAGPLTIIRFDASEGQVLVWNGDLWRGPVGRAL